MSIFTPTSVTGDARWQKVIEAVNEDRIQVVDGDSELYKTPGGASVVSKPPVIVFDRRVARVITPEDPTYQFSDSRYRLQILRQQRGDDGSFSPPDVEDNIIFEPEMDDASFPAGGDNGIVGTGKDVGNRVIAINLAEMTTLKSSEGTHYIVEDGKTIVEVICIYDREDIPIPHWFFSKSIESIGQYQFQVKQMVAQNESGWDMSRAHAALT